MISPELRQFIQRIPKAELHCHLEGAIRPATVLDLAVQHDVRLPFSDLAGAEQFYEFKDLNQFCDNYMLICETLKTAADFERITVDLAADAAAQNILYQEVFITWACHEPRGVAFQALVDGLTAARQIARERHAVEMAFIVDICRFVDLPDALRLVENAHASRPEAGIIGVGLDGPERDNPAGRYKAAFARARELGGLRMVAHAGEDVGPESVWDALDSLCIERIDHGVRAIDDPVLLERIVKSQIPLTVCPISNIALKVYPEMRAHPIKRLMDAGVFVTINSDDPPMFHGNLIANYEQVADTFDLTADDIVTLARNGFRASFLDDARKSDYLTHFDAEVARLRQELRLDR